MTKEQAQVKEFMIKANQKIPVKPHLPTEKIGRLRLNLIGEEFKELANALGFVINFDYTNFEPEPDWANLVDTADAIADLMYVVLGTAVACGIDIEPIFQEVHRSNLTKFVDGTFREDGKYVKGPNYSPANLEPLIEKQCQPT